MNLQIVQNLAINSAKKSGKMLLDNLENIKIVKFKDRQDIATNFDYESERIIVNAIRKKFPGHNINTEESGIIKGKSDYTWVIDPLDGTKYYIRKVPLFCISIALQYKNETIFGLVYNPSTKEMFCAKKGDGAYLNDKKIKVSNQKNLEDAFIYVELPNPNISRNEFNKYSKFFTNLNWRSYRIRVFGSGPLGLCYVALGAFEAYVNLGNPTGMYDLAAGLIILKEAGGKIADLKGNLIKLKDHKKSLFILASNGKIHNKILKLLKF